MRHGISLSSLAHYKGEALGRAGWEGTGLQSYFLLCKSQRQDGGWFAYFIWVYFPLELASIPRRGDCPLVLLGTTISRKAFELRQFYTEQLLGTAAPALLLSVRNRMANVSLLGFLRGST